MCMHNNYYTYVHNTYLCILAMEALQRKHQELEHDLTALEKKLEVCYPLIYQYTCNGPSHTHRYYQWRQIV